MFELCGRLVERRENRRLRAAGQHVAGERDLALPVDAVDRRRPVPGFISTTSSRPTEPRFEDGTVILREAF